LLLLCPRSRVVDAIFISSGERIPDVTFELISAALLPELAIVFS
jgi:hypothetical protein